MVSRPAGLALGKGIPLSFDAEVISSASRRRTHAYETQNSAFTPSPVKHASSTSKCKVTSAPKIVWHAFSGKGFMDVLLEGMPLPDTENTSRFLFYPLIAVDPPPSSPGSLSNTSVASVRQSCQRPAYKYPRLKKISLGEICPSRSDTPPTPKSGEHELLFFHRGGCRGEIRQVPSCQKRNERTRCAAVLVDRGAQEKKAKTEVSLFFLYSRGVDGLVAPNTCVLHAKDFRAVFSVRDWGVHGRASKNHLNSL